MPTKRRFVIPRPGVDGAIGEDGLSDTRFVLTGLFPEVGGGAGLNLGKDKVQSMIQTFGGKVTQAVSGRTNYVVVGKNPGFSKVHNAQTRGIPILDLRSLQQVLLGTLALEDIPHQEPPKIAAFSAGYPKHRIAY